MNAYLGSDCHTCPHQSDCKGSSFPPVAAALRDIASFVLLHGAGRGVSCRRVEDASFVPLRVAARQLAEARRNRSQSLSGALLGEPAWDLLLELAGQEVPQSIKAVSLGAQVPLTTALRWLSLMDQEGLVEQFSDPRDGRRTLVALSAAGTSAVAEALRKYRKPLNASATGQASLAVDEREYQYDRAT